LLAIGLSLGLHGAALASLVLLREVTPPEPYAVITVELVQAADGVGSPEADAGEQLPLSQGKERASAGAAGSTPNMGRLADSGTRDERPAAFTASRESDGSPVARDGEPIPISGPAPTPGDTSDRHETSPRTPAEPPIAAETFSTPETSIEAMFRIPPAPRRKPLTFKFAADQTSTKTPIEEALAETKDRPLRSANQRAAREVVQSDADPAAARSLPTATLNLEKTRVMAALPMTTRGSGIGSVGYLGESPASLPRYAGGGLSNASPRYPYLARRRGLEGRVVLRVRVSAAGNAAAVRVRQSTGYRLLDDAAVEAVETWRFVPASQGGIAVAGSVDVPVTFRLKD
jgi:protein TonB